METRSKAIRDQALSEAVIPPAELQARIGEATPESGLRRSGGHRGAISSPDEFLFLGDRLYKSSAVAETGDGLATINMGRKVGTAVTVMCPFPWGHSSSPVFGPCLLSMSMSVLDQSFPY